jgi:hypothetical protein
MQLCNGVGARVCDDPSSQDVDHYHAIASGEARVREATLSGRSRGLLTVCAAAGLLILVACGSSSDTFVAPLPARCTLQTDLGTAAFAAGGGAGSVRISANRECTWTAQSDAPWIALQPQPSGTGDGSVQFTVAANIDPASRSGELRINDQRVQISQAGGPCRLQLSSTHEALDASGGQRTIQVQANSSLCAWSATADVSWINVVSGQNGTGGGTVVFEVPPTTGPSRTGTLTVGGTSLQVVQGIGCAYSTGLTAINVSAAGGTREVPVRADPGCPWVAQSQAAWISIASGPTGSGPGVVGLSVAATDGPPRTGIVTIAGVPVTVTQSSGCGIAVEPISYTAPAAGGASSVSVRTGPGCPWSATASASWIAITSAAGGSGAGQVQFTVAANTGPARSGSLAIAGQVVSIAQPAGCTFSIMPSAAELTFAAQTGSVALSTGAGCQWTAGTDAGWISLPRAAGSGPAQVSFVVAANSGPPRSASVGIAGREFAIAQASPCTWTVSPPVHDFDASGGLGNVLVIVDGPCTWTASSTANWITVLVGGSGTGNGIVQFIAAPNPGSARSGIIRIGPIDYLVRQSGR